MRLNRLGDVLDGSAKGKSQPRAARARLAKKARRRVVNRNATNMSATFDLERIMRTRSMIKRRP